MTTNIPKNNDITNKALGSKKAFSNRQEHASVYSMKMAQQLNVKVSKGIVI